MSDTKQTIAWLREWGVGLINVSLGCPYYNPHVTRPFERPDDGNYEEPEHPCGAEANSSRSRSGRTSRRRPVAGVNGAASVSFG